MTYQIPLVAALAQAATTATAAPSVHNTQPWHWRVEPDRLELFAVRDRQLTAADPDGRLLTLSCGIALHHARTALAAQGWSVEVQRLPDPARPQLLATLTTAGRDGTPHDGSAHDGSAHDGTPAEAMRLVQCMRVRRTDRRPVSDEAVPQPAVDAVVAAAGAQGARLQPLRPEQVLELAAAASRASAVEAEDSAARAELEYWTSRAAPAGTGLTGEVLPEEPPRTTVPGRDFIAPGTLPIGPGHDRYAVYALLFGDDDEPESWLRAGEALSAAWLVATEHGLGMVPLSGVVENLHTRQELRGMVAQLGHPYLVLRLGVPDPAHAGPPHTPRLPAEAVVDTSAVRGQS